ncbi:hypothetical protein, partial [Terracidiphilus sp.]|uniref:hypothetical protein n=1 Tax=Terracidiphilus sp. TaxID=1964191 RepID=UPI003C21069B
QNPKSPINTHQNTNSNRFEGKKSTTPQGIQGLVAFFNEFLDRKTLVVHTRLACEKTTMIGGSKPETALFSDAHPISDPDDW